MKILYIASAVIAPGSHGGATHVVEVASELAKLGHELRVICAAPRNEPRRPTLPVEGGKSIEFFRLPLPKFLSLASYPTVKRIADEFGPDVVMERYYNFAGAGMLYAHRHKLPSLLEVNALMLDPLGSTKRRLDRYALFNRLKWWAEQQCRWASRIVTPLHTTVPASISRAKIAELPWGANVDRFDPAKLDPAQVQTLRQQLDLEQAGCVAVFAGSFRHWHGIETLVEAAKIALPQDDDLYLLLLGGGPMYTPLQEQVKAAGLEKRVRMPGPLSYEQMPTALSLADVGVAPFDTSKHAPLREAGFYWSPLKIFEYMAMALPTITSNIPPLNTIIRPDQEGLLFQEGDAADLAAKLLQLLAPEQAELRRTMGESARARVVEYFSWRAHCVALDKLIKEISCQ